MACQVQLMGVPHAADLTSGGNNLSGRAVATPRRLLPAKSTVKRALFGSPEPGSVSKMLSEEQQKNHQYVLQRYNFDIKTGTPAMNRTTSNVDSSTSPLPTLIAQEIKDFEAKLNGSDIPNKCCKRSAQKICYNPDSSAVTSSSSRKNAVSSSERHKPYSAQSQVTDYFRVSKSAQMKGPTAVTANSLPIRHHQLEVLQMPSPHQVEEISSTHSEQDDDAEEQSSLVLLEPTLLSVQIVVKAASSDHVAAPVTASQQP